MVRRIPDLNPPASHGQATLFDLCRFHAFFTTPNAKVTDTLAADKVHRHHPIIEGVHADPKEPRALAHLPSSSFAANSAWPALAVMTFPLDPRRRGPGR